MTMHLQFARLCRFAPRVGLRRGTLHLGAVMPLGADWLFAVGLRAGRRGVRAPRSTFGAAAGRRSPDVRPRPSSVGPSGGPRVAVVALFASAPLMFPRDGIAAERGTVVRIPARRRWWRRWRTVQTRVADGRRGAPVGAQRARCRPRQSAILWVVPLVIGSARPRIAARAARVPGACAARCGRARALRRRVALRERLACARATRYSRS